MKSRNEVPEITEEENKLKENLKKELIFKSNLINNFKMQKKK